MKGFEQVVERVCGPPGASSESMVTTFSAARDTSVMRKDSMKSGWILFAFLVLVKRSRSLTAKSRFWAFWSKYSLLTAAAASRVSVDGALGLTWIGGQRKT
uniref:Uncharacterized protein n=1 Tax=Romanomermis culicivorax TaxID=13658 RepID=A0A915IXD1_ROMCU